MHCDDNSAFSLGYAEFDRAPLLVLTLPIVHSQIYPKGITNTLYSNSYKPRPHEPNFTQLV